MKVMKFGGTSVGKPERMHDVATLITRDTEEKIVVLSALSGTTNSLVATVDSGIPLVIADAEGHRLTPSVVHIPAPGAPALVGHAANRVRVVKPSETVYSVKRFIGRRASEISEDEMLVTYPLGGERHGRRVEQRGELLVRQRVERLLRRERHRGRVEQRR